MRLPLLFGLLVLTLVTAAAGQEDRRPAKPPELSHDEAVRTATTITAAANTIAEYYAKPIAPEKLVARAQVALHEAAGVPTPEHLNDLDEALKGRDLVADTTIVLQVLGGRPLIRGDKGVRRAIEAMVSILDPYSTYISTAETVRLALPSASIGLSLEERRGNGPWYIWSVTLGGPAQRAGIRPGDELTAVDDKPPPTDLSAAQFVELRLNGPANTSVALTVRHVDEEATHRLLVRRSTEADSDRVRDDDEDSENTVFGARRRGSAWEYLFDPSRRIAYIRIGQLVAGTHQRLYNVLRALKDAGMVGLLLDLRDTPGGQLTEATDTADLFLGEGVIARSQYRNEAAAANDRKIYHSRGDRSFTGFPIVALIGPNTMGGGELIAAALQDHSRAAVAGQRTRGKASIQQTKDLDSVLGPARSGRHAVRLTVGFFMRPSGKNLHRFADSKDADDWGVRPDPDLELRLPPLLHRQVRAWRLLQDLRAEGDRAALPLDRQENDPVLNLGMKALVGKVK